MKRITVSVIRTTTRLAFGISLILALLFPIGYLVMSYERQSVVVETEAEAGASLVSQLISTNPEYWRYEQPRLDSFLSRRPFKTHQEIWRIMDANGILLAQHSDPLGRPLMTRSHPLYDSGKIVGRVEISRSMRPFLIKTLGLGLLGLALGAGSFFVFRVFPLRALDQALQSLQQSEARFRAIASTAADGIIVIDNHGRITYWNQTAEKMFGYAHGEIVGKELHSLVTPPVYHEPRQGYERLIQTEIDPAIGGTLEFTAIRKDGTTFPVEVSMSAVELNGVRHAVGIIRNISDRKRTENELVKIEKLDSLGILAGGIAHDFNNLLTVILGSISLAQLDAKPSDPMYQRLNDGTKAVLRARDLTQQLLTFARGGAPIRKTASIRDIVEEACGFSLSGSNVKCAFSFGEGLRPVDVDAGQISQVIHNLVINAAQAMPDGGSIHVSCENADVDGGDMLPLMDGRYVKISVKDQGVGIPPEILSKIFDPYFTTKPKGSGLGLATSYSIVKKHGGYIGVESEPGAGSAFHVYLPASLQELPAKPPRPKGPVPGKGRILVMDDEEAVRQTVGEMLKSLGYDPSFARDGVEALATYQRAARDGATFDAVIMDLTIPGGMGGKEAIKKMLDIDPRARVIVASGYSNDPVMADFESHGFSGVIAKPYTMDLLAAILHRIMA